MKKEAVNGSVVWYGYCIDVLNALSEILDYRYGICAMHIKMHNTLHELLNCQGKPINNDDKF